MASSKAWLCSAPVVTSLSDPDRLPAPHKDACDAISQDHLLSQELSPKVPSIQAQEFGCKQLGGVVTQPSPEALIFEGPALLFQCTCSYPVSQFCFETESAAPLSFWNKIRWPLGKPKGHTFRGGWGHLPGPCGPWVRASCLSRQHILWPDHTSCPTITGRIPRVIHSDCLIAIELIEKKCFTAHSRGTHLVAAGHGATERLACG